MRARVVWLLTVVAIAGGCAVTAWRGSDIVRYYMAHAKRDEVRAWFDVPGVAFAAREHALTIVDDLSDAQKTRQRLEDITGILSVRPLSSEYWLSLAKMRQATGEGASKALEALELSTLTGPNEGTVMAHRGLFGVWQWEILPPELRTQTAADLTASELSTRDVAWLKANLSEKPDAVRQEIRAALQSHDFPAAKLTRIGL
jgi:hypothetical protein